MGFLKPAGYMSVSTASEPLTLLYIVMPMMVAVAITTPIAAPVAD